LSSFEPLAPCDNHLMPRFARLALIVLALIVVLLGLGYVWGSSGRSAAEDALQGARQGLDIAEARGHLLDARVSLYNMNFGEASKRLEDAKDPLRRTRDRYRQGGDDDAARNITTALERIDEAQRLAGQLDQAANSKAGEALDAIRLATSK
jgi:hypothetical protein